jgi:hypothetical protein
MPMLSRETGESSIQVLWFSCVSTVSLCCAVIVQGSMGSMWRGRVSATALNDDFHTPGCYSPIHLIDYTETAFEIGTGNLGTTKIAIPDLDS